MPKKAAAKGSVAKKKKAASPKEASPKGAAGKGGSPKGAAKGAGKSKKGGKKNMQESNDKMALSATGSPIRTPRALEGPDQPSEKKVEVSDCACGCDGYCAKQKPEMRSCSCYANFAEKYIDT